MFGQYKRSSLLILKGVDLVDEKSSANYLFVEYAYKKAYKRIKFRYSVLTSVNNPALAFDSKGSMSGASIGLSCGKYPRFELSGFYIVPWYYDPNYIIKPKIVWEKSNEESFSICSWYNSGMFSKKTGLSAGVEYASKKIVLKNGMHAKISIVYNYDIAGNILHIENQSSKDVFSIRTFLNF